MTARDSRSRHALPFVVLAAAGVVVLLSGCASDGGSPPDASASPGIAVVDAAAALVPASIRDAGVLTVAIPTNEPPTQYYKEGTTEMTGVNPDMARLIAGALGLELNIEVTNFDGIIPGLAADRFDMTVSSMTPTEQRMETLDFVDYAQLGSALGVMAGNPDGITLDDLCGRDVALLTGSYQLSVDIPLFDEACAAAGKDPVNPLQFQDTRQAISAVLSGRAHATYADSPIIAYAAKQNPQFEVAEESAFAPVAVGIPHDTGMLEPVTQAIDAIIRSSEYTEMLAAYGLESMAITDARVNAPQG